MSDRSSIAPAPARGRYDRALSRKARQAEQKARLVGWIAQVYHERGPGLTVHDVVQAAGVGRNTFYEYFDGLDHALDYAAQTHAKLIHERVVSAIESARTRIAKLRELSRAWFDELEKDPARAALLLRLPPPVPSSAGSPASSVFASLLGVVLEEGRSYGAASTHAGHPGADPDRGLIDYAAFAAEGGARSLLTGGAPRSALQEGLATLLTRVFR